MSDLIEDLTFFINNFIKKRARAGYLSALPALKRAGNMMSAMSNLSCLDERYCTEIPHGSKAEEIRFIKRELENYKLVDTCRIFSEVKSINGNYYSIEEGLELAVGGGPVLVLFSKKAAFFETESPGISHLCILP